MSRSYWAEGIPLELVKRSLENSLCFGVFYRGQQVGLARVVTDQSTFAYLCDVYVLEEHRGRGLSKWMLDEVMADSRLQGLRRFMLAARDAHQLYEGYGFRAPEMPQSLMEIRKQAIYRQTTRG